MSEEKIEGIVTSWGTRLQVPVRVLRELGLSVGDRVEWVIKEEDGKRVAILRKKKEVMKVIEQVKAELDIVVCHYCGREVRGDSFISANQLAGEAGWELEGDNLWTCPDCLQDRDERGGGDEPRKTQRLFIRCENGLVEIEDGIYKLFSPYDDEYQGFITVINNRVVESQDTDSEELQHGVEAVKISDVPTRISERKQIAYKYGFFTTEESYQIYQP